MNLLCEDWWSLVEVSLQVLTLRRPLGEVGLVFVVLLLNELGLPEALHIEILQTINRGNWCVIVWKI